MAALEVIDVPAPRHVERAADSVIGGRPANAAPVEVVLIQPVRRVLNPVPAAGAL